MKNNLKIALALIIGLAATSCNNNQNQKNMKADKNELNAIFPKGKKGSKDLFTGNVYPTALVDSDSIYNPPLAHVYH